jgi:hypothetical protein
MCAAHELDARRLVVRWNAAGRERDEHTTELQAVVLGGARGLRGEPSAVKRAKEEVSRAVSREDATRAIGAVRTRREPDNDDACGGITEACDRASMIRLASVGQPLVASHSLAIAHEPRAGLARLDAMSNKLEALFGSGHVP